MALKFGFFNSVNGDRKYNADDISNYFLKLISNGVFATPSNAMQVQATAGMTVNVSAGWAFINCKWLENTAAYPLILDSADVVLNRIDRIVLRLSESPRTMGIYIKKGTPASTPTPPELARTKGVIWELSLAKISIHAGVTDITQSMITDERADTELCGWVTGLIDQIDTTNLFAQFTNAFNTWFSEIKDEVQSTTILRQYTSRYVTLSENEDNIPIGIPQYVENLDTINVFVNGMRLKNGTDYIIDDTNIVLTTALSAVGTPVDVEIFKSIDGDSATSVISLVYQLQLIVNDINSRMGGLTFRKMTAAQYNALSVKDDNTVYFVIDESGTTIYIGDMSVNQATPYYGISTAQAYGTSESIYGIPEEAGT